MKLIEATLVASKAPYIPSNTKNVIGHSNAVKNYLVTIVSAVKKEKPAEEMKKLIEVLKVIGKISEMIGERLVKVH